MAKVVSKPKFDTCFFERYAKITLETILGEKYSKLVNKDRPDLQSEDNAIGIEVTRALKESKVEAIKLLNEMAVAKVKDVSGLTEKRGAGYVYGLVDTDSVGAEEYRYWLEASPLKRVIENKVKKVINGFYGDFNDFGLYIFTKDDMTPDDLIAAMKLTMELQSGAEQQFQTLYISEIQNLYVCDVATLSYKQYPISEELCKKFFINSI
ncbi:MAG: hypothetical protein IKT77_02895 [Paludibacteraceae bacterium]|nr:hypothetical protein [Paludibacteraceae bacterium]